MMERKKKYLMFPLKKKKKRQYILYFVKCSLNEGEKKMMLAAGCMILC